MKIHETYDKIQMRQLISHNVKQAKEKTYNMTHVAQLRENTVDGNFLSKQVT